MKIVSLASTVWNQRWMNRQQLMSRVGKRHAVVYSNAAWNTWDRLSDEWKAGSWTGNFVAQDNVWLDQVPKWLMRMPRIPVVDRVSLRAHCRRWRTHLDQHGQGPVVLHMFHPAYEAYVDAMNADLVVYQPYDAFAKMPGWSEALETAEIRLLRRADLVVSSSEWLSNGLAEKGGRSVVTLPNGLDYELFATAVASPPSIPEDLARIPRPRLGYLGWLERHVDLALVRELALRHKEWNFVFVGGMTPQPDDRLRDHFAACRDIPNIHFLGSKDRQAVPAYMLHMDINTICWRLGEGGWAEFGYPLKLQEYMACGQPIVSADLHCIRAMPRKIIATARNLGEWESAISDALASGGPGTAEQRREVAKQSGWDQRANELCDLLEGAWHRRSSARPPN